MDIKNGNAEFDVAVIGGGPAGLAAAIALAMRGVRTALVARRAAYGDNRTTALLGGSVDFLRDLGIWEACASAAAPLRVMRLVDDTRRLIHAPDVSFRSDEIDLDAFGYNIENRNLVAAMEARAQDLLVRFDDDATDVVPTDSGVEISTTEGRTMRAHLAVGADGRQSLCRAAAGIDVSRRQLDQVALTFNVAHARPHGDVSTEFHTAQGPCVFVPLPDHRSSVVWVNTAAETERLAALSDEDLSAAIERQAHSHLGRMRVEPNRHRFPLAFEQPVRLAARRIALIGEAAHVLPPIGAQGLNLGLRDARAIADIAADAVRDGGDPGSDTVLESYMRSRRADILGRSSVIDLANRTLLADFLPLQAARSLGMQALASIGPLRRLVMRQALVPATAAPQAGRS